MYNLIDNISSNVNNQNKRIHNTINNKSNNKINNQDTRNYILNKLDNNFTYKNINFPNTTSFNINNTINPQSKHMSTGKFTIINKRHIDHNKVIPVYNSETKPTINPILKRPVTIEDIIIKNNLYIKEYNNAVLEKKENDIKSTYKRSWDLNFNSLTNKKNCNLC
jgi:hypothetical protein